MKNLMKLSIVFFGLVACNSEVADTEGSAEDNVSIETENSNEAPVELMDAEVELTPDEHMQSFYNDGVGDIQVMIRGIVIKNLADDNEGSRHQKFIVELASGQTILVSHNIDLADRVKDLAEGDEVIVHGEYEWNDRGGVIHWTHHDPNGQHIDGYIKHEGLVYG